MYTNKPITIGTTLVPKGAAIIDSGTFIWEQIMASIRILANQPPNRSQEISYWVEGKDVHAILNEVNDLYIWTN